MRFKMYTSIALLMVLMALFAGNIFAQNRTTFDQIQLLLNEKASRTPAQRKITSQLLQAVREKAGKKMVEGVNLDPANVNADAQSRVEVDISAKVNSGLLANIIKLGGSIESSFPQYNAIRAKIPLSVVEAVAALPEVKSIEPAAIAQIGGEGLNNINDVKKSAGNFSGAAATSKRNKLTFEQRVERVKQQVNNYLNAQYNPLQNTFIGSVTSQGDRTHRADDVRNVYGAEGQGIRIGVISDSYNSKGGEAADIASGDLPGLGNPFGNTTPVTVVQEASATDEGRAMLQIVHDLAPKAQLYFSTGYGSPANFANNIIKLRNAPNNCDIIIDDLSYLNEPVFEDGQVTQAVNTVTAAGCLYFSSASNSGSFLRGTSGVWEGDFNDAGSLPFAGTSKTGTIHNFGTISSPSNGDIITGNGGPPTTYLNLHWSDKWGASGNDYDLFLVDINGTVKSSSTTVQNGSGNPYEEIQVTSSTLALGSDRLVVFKTSTAEVRAISLNTNRGKLSVSTTGQTHGHASAVNAFCVAATPAAASADGTFPGPFPNPFVATNHVEYFSSDGPRRMFYNPDGTAITPGNLLFGTNGGTVRQKPDITAANGVVTTVPGLTPFYGTSAAAPHAGAIAALLLSAKPTLTAAQVRTALTSTALDIEAAGYDINSGYGIVQAFQAVQSVNPDPISNITLGSFQLTEGAFSNNNNLIDPGELAKMVVKLTDPALAAATSVVATLSSTTAGVTITQPTASYGTIPSAGSASNTATPFLLGVSSSVPCGTLINFKLLVSFGGGGPSPQAFTFTVRVGAYPTISSKLGQIPPSGPGYTVTTGNQTGRVNRETTGLVSSCATPLAYPGLAATTGDRRYDAYKFTNSSAVDQCITVTVNNPATADIFTVAYNNSGFDPANPGSNFVADAGNSFAVQTFSFTVPAGQSYTIVIHDAQVLPTTGATYTLDVSNSNCVPLPVCTPIIVAPATLPVVSAAVAYSQVFTATGGSGSYIFSETGTLPTGLSFSGNTLSGTTTQTGSFPITVNAVDAAGCTTGTKNYTLVVSAVAGPPALITAIAGTPQTTAPSTAFTTALQAKVTDAASIPVSGVTVTFTAPAAGASGNFPGPSLTATAVTNASGIATAPLFTANATTGTFNVSATTAGVATAANFVLTTANVPCVITCPANITVNNTAGQCGAIVNYPAATSTGNCGTITSVPASGTFFPTGTTTVNVSSGAGSCSFTVTVNDTEPPVFTCPGNITVNTDANACSAVVSFALPTVTDNCSGVVSISASPASGATFAKGVTPVTITAKDVAGNITTCTFNVTVKDAQAPVITCPQNIVTTSTPGLCTGIVTFTATATDNCPGVVVTSVPASGTAFPSGTTTVTSTATDVAGNTATCSFTVTITDGQIPVITTQPVGTVACLAQNATFSVVSTNAVSYQWQVNANGTWVNVPSSNSATLLINNVTASMSNNQYRVIVSGVCTNTTSNAVTLTTKSSPVVTLSASPYTSLDPSLHSTLTTTVNAAGNYSYVYKKDGVIVPGLSGTSVPLSIDEFGTYQVIVTDLTTQCPGLSNLVTIKDSASSRLFVYPNPTSGQFQVRYYNQGGVATARTMNVYDARGAKVFSRKYETTALYQKMDVNISNLSAGVYMIIVRDANGVRLASGKLVKK